MAGLVGDGALHVLARDMMIESEKDHIVYTNNIRGLIYNAP